MMPGLGWTNTYIGTMGKPSNYFGLFVKMSHVPSLWYQVLWYLWKGFSPPLSPTICPWNRGILLLPTIGNRSFIPRNRLSMGASKVSSKTGNLELKLDITYYPEVQERHGTLLSMDVKSCNRAPIYGWKFM